MVSTVPVGVDKQKKPYIKLRVLGAAGKQEPIILISTKMQPSAILLTFIFYLDMVFPTT